MAYWNRKPDRQGQLKYVFVYTRQDGKQKPLPRSQTKHMDTWEEAQIEHWVRQYEAQFERPKIHPDSINYSNSQITEYVHRFVQYRVQRKGRHQSTEEYMGRMLLQWVIPYFLKQDPPAKDPNVWPGTSIRLLEYMEEKQVALHTQRCLNTFLRQFWEWLTEEHIVHTPSPLRLRNPIIKANNTPLKRLVTPDEVLAFYPDREEIRMLALLGYFFSLRTQEQFGLKKQDFRAGSQVLPLSCSQAFTKLGLFNRLAVHINETRSGSGAKPLPPKTKVSKDWVCCWNEEAAKEIVQFVRGKDGYLFPERPDYWIKTWKKEGLGVTLKDLRRASLWHLGHEVDGMSLLALKNHARHSRIDTTLLYLRKPEEEVPDLEGDLDLEA